jgi:hypothetical protein
MFRRRRAKEDPSGLQEFIRQTAHLMDPNSPESARLFQEAFPSAPAPSGPPAEDGDDFLPPGLRAPGERRPAGEMMEFPWPLVIDGTVRTCPECGVDRDWLVMCAGPHVWLRCRSAHETHEPALNSAWFHRICGPVEELHTTKDEGVTKMGFDGTFSGITFPA